MIYTTTLTQKGQVTIPLELRKLLNVAPYEKVAFKKQGKNIIITAAKDFLSLKGSIKAKVKYDNQKVDESVQNYIAEEYARK